MDAHQTIESYATQHANRIRSNGIIAIVRGDFPPHRVLEVAWSLLAGGIEIIEVTLNTTDALEGIQVLRREIGQQMLIGAGTVRTPTDVELARSAGAEFMVAPNFDPASVELSHQLNLLHLPGILTPTEAQAALSAGCSMVKLFPTDLLGPAYLRALRAPLDDIEFVPTGGVNANNLANYLQMGAAAIGMGSALVTSPDQNLTELTERAARLVSIVRQVRSKDTDR